MRSKLLLLHPFTIMRLWTGRLKRAYLQSHADSPKAGANLCANLTLVHTLDA